MRDFYTSQPHGDIVEIHSGDRFYIVVRKHHTFIFAHLTCDKRKEETAEANTTLDASSIVLWSMFGNTPLFLGIDANVSVYKNFKVDHLEIDGENDDC